MKLEIKSIVKKYGEKTVLKNVSFDVESGQICAFIGKNGAGKTTTLKAICGIINFDSGDIVLDGKSVKENALYIKSLIGYLPDNPDLYNNLTGYEYLNFVLNVFKVDKQTAEKRIEEISKRLTIFDHLKEQISSYSHGMKQKLALVSVFAHKPKLYLFDEPFVGLDPTASHELKLMMREAVEEGAMFLYSTHILEVAEKICDSVVIINNGEIVKTGDMKSVKGDKSLESIFLGTDEGEENE